MNMIEEMNKINEYELNKRVVLIKIYDFCLKIKNSRLPMYQKNRKIQKWYNAYLNFCRKKNNEIRNIHQILNLY
jgi:hypothetical protein